MSDVSDIEEVGEGAEYGKMGEVQHMLMPVCTISIALDTRPDAPAGPGWYVVGAHNDGKGNGKNLKSKKITIQVAQELATYIGNAIHSIGDDDEVTPFEVINKGSEAAKEYIIYRLKQAESVATTIPSLRRAIDDLEIKG